MKDYIKKLLAFFEASKFDDAFIMQGERKVSYKVFNDKDIEDFDDTTEVKFLIVDSARFDLPQYGIYNGEYTSTGVITLEDINALTVYPLR